MSTTTPLRALADQHVSRRVAGYRTDGPGVFDGVIDGESFRAYIDQILVPTLHPGDLVIADNLGAHKVAGIQRAIQAAGATLWYLPPYSPDLNPIELCFAKLKALVRTARCRSTETLWPFLASAWRTSVRRMPQLLSALRLRRCHTVMKSALASRLFHLRRLAADVRQRQLGVDGRYGINVTRARRHAGVAKAHVGNRHLGEQPQCRIADLATQDQIATEVELAVRLPDQTDAPSDGTAASPAGTAGGKMSTGLTQIGGDGSLIAGPRMARTV